MSQFGTRTHNYKLAANRVLAEVCEARLSKERPLKALFLESGELNTFKELRRLGVSANDMFVPNPDEAICSLLERRGVNAYCEKLFDCARRLQGQKTGPMDDIDVLVPLLADVSVIAITLCQRKAGRKSVRKYMARLREAAEKNRFSLVDAIDPQSYPSSMTFRVLIAIRKLRVTSFRPAQSAAALAKRAKETRVREEGTSEVCRGRVRAEQSPYAVGDIVSIHENQWPQYEGPFVGYVLYRDETKIELTADEIPDRAKFARLLRRDAEDAQHGLQVIVYTHEEAKTALTGKIGSLF